MKNRRERIFPHGQIPTNTKQHKYEKNTINEIPKSPIKERKKDRKKEIQKSMEYLIYKPKQIQITPLIDKYEVQFVQSLIRERINIISSCCFFVFFSFLSFCATNSLLFVARICHSCAGFVGEMLFVVRRSLGSLIDSCSYSSALTHSSPYSLLFP